MDLDILKIASDTNNNKNLSSYTHFSKSKNSICGDEIQIKLIIEKKRIIDFAYQGKSCVYCQATASLLSKISINKSKIEINELCNDAKSYFEKNFGNVNDNLIVFEKIFHRKNLARKECILLPFKTLKKIVSK